MECDSILHEQIKRMRDEKGGGGGGGFRYAQMEG